MSVSQREYLVDLARAAYLSTPLTVTRFALTWLKPFRRSILGRPGSADVIGAGEDQQNGEEKQAAPNNQGDHFGRVFHVHKEEEDQRCLGNRDGESDDGIENAEILESCEHSCPGEDEQNQPNDYIDLRRNDVSYASRRHFLFFTP